MPELPEVETIRLSLLKKLVGEEIIDVQVRRKLSIGYPKPQKFCDELRGKTFTNITRRGKYLLFHFEQQEEFLIAHLGMSGRLLLIDTKSNVVSRDKFIRAVFILSNKRRLLFEDMRVFGRLWFIRSNKLFAKVIPSFNNLGIEPLEGLTADQLRKTFFGRRQPIKSALLDQRLLAGIGNIYADEILFQAGIHPLRKAGQIRKMEVELLIKVIPDVLGKAIRLGGSSIKDFVDGRGINGNYQNSAFVYGRAGEECRVCKSIIEKLKLAGRSTHFCPVCQK